MASGGARKGAGRPKGKGRYNEPTKAIRLPISVISALDEGYLPQPLPLYLSKISAGFPSPAENDIAERLDLHKFLVKKPTSTFLVKANGQSMINAGIHDNDLLVVDRSITPSDGKIVIAVLDGQLTVKRLKKNANGQIILAAENPEFESIDVPEGSDMVILGVVTNVIHSV